MQSEWRMLLVFDFDHTVVEENTDFEVQDLWDVEKAAGKKLDGETVVYTQERGWTQYMDDVMGALHGQGVTHSHIADRMHKLRLTQDMEHVFREAKQTQRCDVIIASDSNTFFIDTILEKHGLKDVVDAVFTNPAQLTESGRLAVTPFDNQTDCSRCSRNMCKSKIVADFIESKKGAGVNYTHYAYAGDGGNDFCPMASLPADGTALALVRKGFSLEKRIEAHRKKGVTIGAKRVDWSHPTEFLPALRDFWASLEAGTA
eukprot:TRINITY_DN9281_c0_g1_i2.p1 TRINITY_DN9281_c0_g1~~TRINITY_DN9281_c0_g1_i2.p1  ORF type:complete len:259 (+),score=113.26 TRINITY_DN9281_c0_g1_i2:751-1527(+)